MVAHEPAHRRIEKHLRDLIAQGAGRAEPLPKEVELAERFGVSRMTVRQAFNSLVAAGLVVRYRSKGSFAAVRVLEDMGALTSEDFLARWAAQGHRVAIRVLTFETRPAPTSVATLFGQDQGASLSYIERLRLVDGQPLAWDTRWVPVEFGQQVTRADLETTSLFSLLFQHGIPVADMSFEVRAHPARAIDARRLGCRRGSPLLHRELVCTTAAGQTIISGVSTYPAEHVSYRGRVTFNGPYQPFHLSEEP